MPDKLIIQDLQFFGHCGITAAERETGQRLAVDLEIEYDVRPVAASDDLHNAINYAAVARRVVEVGSAESFTLIETLAERLGALLLKEFGVRELRLRLRKPQPPIAPTMAYAAVEIHRKA